MLKVATENDRNKEKNDIMLPKPWLKALGGGTAALVLGMLIGYRAPDDIERTRVHVGRSFTAECADRIGSTPQSVRDGIRKGEAKGCLLRGSGGFLVFIDPESGKEIDPDTWKEQALYLPRCVARISEKGVTAEGKCVFAAVWKISKRWRKQCDARVETIAEEAGVCKHTARGWLPRFRALGAFWFEDRKRLNKDTYVIREEDVHPDVRDWIGDFPKQSKSPPESKANHPLELPKAKQITPESKANHPEETSVRDVRRERDVVKETALRPASLRSVSAEVPETEPDPVSGISEVSGFQRLRPVPTFPYMSGTGVDEKKAPGSLVDASSSRKVAEASRLPESLSRGEPDASLMEGHWFSAPTPKPLSQERKYQKAQELLTAA